MDTRAKPRASTIAMAILGVVALILYAWFVATNSATAYGDAVVGQAIEALMALGLLWVTLLVLMIVDRAVAGPSWPRRAGFVLAPIALVATTFATDYPHDPICQAGVLGTPFLIGLYVLAGRMAPHSAARAQAAILLLLAAFSVYAIQLFSS